MLLERGNFKSIAFMMLVEFPAQPCREPRAKEPLLSLNLHELSEPSSQKSD